MRPKVILHIVGCLILATGLGMTLPIAYALRRNDAGLRPLSLSLIAFAAAGFGLIWFSRRRPPGACSLSAREGMAAAALGWLTVGILGSLPYLMGGTLESFTDAAFESFSGFSTTGSSVIPDIEKVAPSILIWRGMTHWLGGMGIIVLSLAILPHLGAGGMQLYRAEVPGPSFDKLTPRLRDTAATLWRVYLAMTIAMIGLLLLGEMNFYEALAHAFATVATGGFSTRNDSLAGFGPYTQWVCTGFMFMAGVNFTLHFQLLRGKGRALLEDEEFRLYAWITAAAVMPLFLYLLSAGLEFEPAIRIASFQVASILTTTGFASADYLAWAPLPQALILILMVLGGSAGSTAGGVKQLRALVLGKLVHREALRVAHPGIVRPTKFNHAALPADVINGCAAFIALFFFIWALSTLILAACGVDLATSAGAALTCLSNVGPGFGSVGPAANFQHLPDPVKWVLALDMLMGRLELFTLFVPCFPEFWRR